MSRYLFVLLTILVAGLAVVLGGLWLWIGTIALLGGGLALLGWRFWNEYQDRKTRQPTSEPSGPRESLEDLGIIDPQAAEAQASESEPDSAFSDTAEPDREDASSSPSRPSEPGPSTDAPSSPNRSETESTDGRNTETTRVADRPVITGDAPVFGPFLQSLRAALHAQTVCLLVQEEIALTYHIEALASVHSRVQRGGTFDTQTPLLKASMSRQTVSVRRLRESEMAIEDLGYYDDPPNIDHLAVAPVPRPDEPTTTFLLADATAGSELGRSRARTLLEHYAEIAALLLEADHVSEGKGEQVGRSQENGERAVSSSESGSAAEASSETPRPRREIIAEEMEAAEADSEELSLVLVYLNRAESIARQGDEAVATAERLLRARLEQYTPGQRVERFGELTYGIFYQGGADVVESWVSDLEATMAKEEGELEGGVSVGVAVWGAHHEGPEALRADATEALREAYKTGTCTVVA